MEDVLRDVLLCCDIKTLITIQILPYRTILDDYFWRQRFERDKIPDYVNYNIQDYLKYNTACNQYKQILINNYKIYLDTLNNDTINFINLNYTNDLSNDYKLSTTYIYKNQLDIIYISSISGDRLGPRVIMDFKSLKIFIRSVLYKNTYKTIC